MTVRGVGGSGSASGGASSVTTNAAKLSKYRAAVTKTLYGTSNTKVLCIGDSLTVGRNAGAAADNYTWAVSAQIAAALKLHGVPASWESRFGCSFGSGISDPRLTQGSWLPGTGGPSLGGILIGSNSAGAPMTFTPTRTWDTCDVWYQDQGSPFGIDIAIDGVAFTSLTSGGSAGFRKVTLTATLGFHTISFNRTSGIPFIAGIEPYNSAVKEVRVVNAGYNGAKSGDWNSSTFAYSPLPAIGTYAPDLSIINLGTNDFNIGPVPVSTFITNMQAIIDKCLLSGDVIIQSPNPTSTAITAQAVQQTYIDAMTSLAATNNLVMVDVFSAFGTYTAANALGYMSDTTHMKAIGYLAAAQLVSEVLTSITPKLGGARPTEQLDYNAQTCYTTANVTAVTATLATATGLTAYVESGGIYSFSAKLLVTPDAVGGHKYSIDGSATATSVIYQILSMNNALNSYVISAKQTALGGASSQAGATDAFTTIDGVITVNAGGTLSVNFAQSTASGTSTLLAGSSFVVTRIG